MPSTKQQCEAGQHHSNMSLICRSPLYVFPILLSQKWYMTTTTFLQKLIRSSILHLETLVLRSGFQSFSGERVTPSITHDSLPLSPIWVISLQNNIVELSQKSSRARYCRLHAATTSMQLHSDAEDAKCQSNAADQA